MGKDGAEMSRWLRAIASHHSDRLLKVGAVGGAITAAGLLLSEELSRASDQRVRQKLAVEFAALDGVDARKSPPLDERKEWQQAPTLWAGTVQRAEPGLLEGPHMLRGSRRGDLVEVSADGVGPDASYVFARNVASGASGLHPKGWIHRTGSEQDE